MVADVVGVVMMDGMNVAHHHHRPDLYQVSVFRRRLAKA